MTTEGPWFRAGDNSPKWRLYYPEYSNPRAFFGTDPPRVLDHENLTFDALADEDLGVGRTGVVKVSAEVHYRA
jgi:hypothetical protein